MQQWEDWRPGYDVRVLVEKTALTLLVVSLSYFLWQGWASTRREAAVPYRVALPELLKHTPRSGPEEDTTGGGPSEEVRERRSRTGQTLTATQVYNGKIFPRATADGRLLQDEPIIPATTQDIDKAIARAESAQKQWRNTTFSQRRKVLRTLLRYINEHQAEIVTACCLDSGKTKIDACLGEILVTVEKLQWTIKHGEKALTPSSRPTNLLMSYKRNTVFYEPLGVVAACVSWNYPFHNVISPMISALFSGNAIVVKPSELTCWSTQYFMSFIQEALKVCGHSPHLAQTVICLPDVADHLTSHPNIKHITFIGSREVAHKVAASAARALTPVVVELGGKDPAVILEDPRTVADLESVASILLRGVFQSAGQNCIGIERIIALPGIHDLLLEHVEPTIKALRLGSVLLDSSVPDMGAMVSSRSFTGLENLIQDAVSDGAILHCGGTRYIHPQHPGGHYFLPTLLSNVTPNMAIAQTELFGPVFLLMKAATVDEAVEFANSTMYSLGAAVFGHESNDVKKCVSSIRAGSVAVNDFATFYVCSMPFGGRDGSGYGRFGGEEGLRGLCNIKSLCEDAPWAKALNIQTRIPGILRYPIEGRRGWQAVQGIVETGYGVGFVPQLRGVRKLLGALMRKETQSE